MSEVRVMQSCRGIKSLCVHQASRLARMLLVRLFCSFWIGLCGFYSATLANEAEHRTATGPRSVADLAERLIPAVVNISTQSVHDDNQGVAIPSVPEGSPFQDFFDDFFEHSPDGTERQQTVQSLGSGFVIDASGLIVTNHHVIFGADEITVKLADGSRHEARIIGRDTKTDLALLKVDAAPPMQTVRFAPQQDLRVGDWVMAIGNPFGLGGSVSVGIVSARNRDIKTGPYDSFIQTDAAINRGNSGGPLFDMYGNVVGVNTVIISQTGTSIGLGFAIPSQIADRVVQQLIEFGETRRGWLGIRIQEISEDLAEGLGLTEDHGVLVSWVNDDGPADKAGLLPGDVIVSYGGSAINTVRDLTRLAAESKVGTEMTIRLVRKGRIMTVPILVGHLESNQIIVPKEKEAKAKGLSFMGIGLAELTEAERKRHNLGDQVEGVVVAYVEPNSPAANKHIQTGMVIVEINQEIVSTPEAVMQRIEALKQAGRKTIVFLLARPDGGELVFIPLKTK